MLFEEDGLKVVAAPWRYALAAKLSRLMQPKGPTRDFDDALTYLHEMIALRGSDGPVPADEVVELGHEFKITPANDQLLNRLAEGYQQKYGTAGLLLAAE